MLFLQSDCDTTVEDGSGFTAGHHAAAKDHLDCLRFLVKHGSDKEVRENHGRTLAHLVNIFGFLSLDGYHSILITLNPGNHYICFEPDQR